MGGARRVYDDRGEFFIFCGAEGVGLDLSGKVGETPAELRDEDGVGTSGEGPVGKVTALRSVAMVTTLGLTAPVLQLLTVHPAITERSLYLITTFLLQMARNNTH